MSQFNRFTLGNDIVALNLVESQNKYCNNRFLSRVFTIKEKEAIFDHPQKNRILWSIWAAKEAAFKACQKQDINTLFSYREFHVTEAALMQLLEHYYSGSKNNLTRLKPAKNLVGELIYKNKIIKLQWQWSNNFVHCSGLLNANETSVHSEEKIETKIESNDRNQDQSLHVRELAKQLLLELGVNEKIEIIRPDIKIRDRTVKGPPLIMKEGRITNDEISLSHHGSYSAVAFLSKLSSPRRQGSRVSGV